MNKWWYITAWIAFFIFMLIDPIVNYIYKDDIIVSTYEKCSDWCIKDNNSYLCNCKTIEEKEETPLHYLTLIVMIVLFLYFMPIFIKGLRDEFIRKHKK